MSYFYVFKLNKKWVRLGFIIFLAFIAAFILWIEEIGFISASKEDQQAVLIKGNPNYEHLALTFNISWGEEKVYPILDALEKHDVRATFFLNGEWAEKNPHILEDIAENKHEIGMLGYRYESYVDKEIEEVRQDLYKAKEVFDKLNFNDIEFIRAPNGHFNDDIINLTGQLGFKLIHWNVNPNDWENPGTEVIIDHVIQNASNGDIILLHASDSAKQTGTALETLLPHLKEDGFSFVTISELISETETNIKNIE